MIPESSLLDLQRRYSGKILQCSTRLNPKEKEDFECDDLYGYFYICKLYEGDWCEEIEIRCFDTQSERDITQLPLISRFFFEYEMEAYQYASSLISDTRYSLITPKSTLLD